MEENNTIKEAKAYLRANWHDGIECPCCTQFVKLYKVKLNTGMAYVLIQFYKAYLFKKPMAQDKWVHPIKDFKTINGDYAKLRHWGLVEKMPEEETENKKTTDQEDDKKGSGYWRITEKGKLFVQKQIKVTSNALLFNNKCYGVTGKDIDIVEALRNKFSYSELMSRGFDDPFTNK